MRQSCYSMKVRLVIASTVMWVAGFAATASAETLYYFEPHTGYRETVDTANPGRFATQAPTARVGGTRGGSITFNIVYADVTGNTNVGFDDPTLGATRQATLSAVLTYVEDILNETTGASIDVNVAASQTDGSGFLASAGSFFSGTAGFTNGLCFQHITTGTDPNGSVADINMTVDFGWNWNSDMGAVGPSEFDLFSVLLHEITHGLGFLGLTDPDGTSSIAPGGNPGAYSVLNQLTRLDDSGPIGTGSTTQLWTTTGGASYVGTAGNLTGTRLVFTGTNAVAVFGSNPAIYSESPFATGTSQSHWSNAFIDVSVMSGFFNLNTEIREYAPFEVGALKDIGYANASAGPPPAPDTDQDLLTDDVETDTGTFVDATNTGTDPNDPDSDDDGVMDGIEVSLGTDPNNPLDFPTLPVAGALALAVALAGAGVLVFVRMNRKTAR